MAAWAGMAAGRLCARCCSVGGAAGACKCCRALPLASKVHRHTRRHTRPPATQIAERYAGGCHKGQLTLIGQQQALDFGRWLRWRYAMLHPLLPLDGFDPAAVAARTTNYQRTIATLQVRAGRSEGCCCCCGAAAGAALSVGRWKPPPAGAAAWLSLPCLLAPPQGVLSGLFPGAKQPIRVATTEEIDEIL